MNSIEKIFKSKLVSNGIWLFVLQVFNTVVPMVTLPYVTRVLGASGYGDFSLALNWILYFQVLVEYGFGYWGARKVAVAGKEEIQDTFSQIFTARIFLAILSFGTMVVVYLLSGKPTSHFVCMAILFCMVIGVAMQLTWLFQGMQNMKFITIVNAISRLVSVVLIFIFVTRENDVYLYCFLYTVTFLLSGIFGLVVAKRQYGVCIKICQFSSALKAIRESWPLFISQAMSKILSGFGITVLGACATSSAIGIYSAVYKIPYTVILFFNPISQALYPDISVQFGISPKAGIERVKKIARIILPFFGMLEMILILANKPIVQLLFGTEYSASSTLLIPLTLWTLFSIVNNFLGIQILVGSEHQKEYSNAFLISAITSIILNILMGKFAGTFGIAYATLLSEIVLTAILWYKVQTVLKEKDNDKTTN